MKHSRSARTVLALALTITSTLAACAKLGDAPGADPQGTAAMACTRAAMQLASSGASSSPRTSGEAATWPAASIANDTVAFARSAGRAVRACS